VADFEAYLDAFSPNVQDILDNFEFRNQIPRLSKADALGTLNEKFLSPDINLSPHPVLSLFNISHEGKGFSLEDKGYVLLNEQTPARFEGSHLQAVKLHHPAVIKNDHVCLPGGVT
jgi:hypothetical protein